MRVTYTRRPSGANAGSLSTDHVPCVTRCGFLPFASIVQRCAGALFAREVQALSVTSNQSSCALMRAASGDSSRATYANARPSGRHANDSTPFFASVMRAGSPPSMRST